jgi:hypothetical protein
MTEQQEFFKLALLESLDITTKKGIGIVEEFSNKHNIPSEKLKVWFNEFKKVLTRIKGLATKEKVEGFGSAKIFFEWYLEQPRTCYYCGIEEKVIVDLFKSKKIAPKKPAWKNGTLQIERKDPNKGYVRENCALACVLCNNAKSDLVSADEFKPIAAGIREFLNQKVKK